LADLDAGEQEAAVRGDEGVGGVHGDVAAPAEQRAVLEAEEVGVAFLNPQRRRIRLRPSPRNEKHLEGKQRWSTHLAYVALGRRHGGALAAGGEEGQALVLAGQPVGGVDLAVAARAEGGVVGAAEDARLRRLAGAAQHLHGKRRRRFSLCVWGTRQQGARGEARGPGWESNAKSSQWLLALRHGGRVAVRYYGGARRGEEWEWNGFVAWARWRGRRGRRRRLLFDEAFEA